MRLDAGGWADVTQLLHALRLHGTAVVLEIAADRMHRNGHVSTRSENGVWLVAAVPPAYLPISGFAR